MQGLRVSVRAMVPCDMVFPVGRLRTSHAPWAVFRLVVDEAELEGRS